MRNQSYTYLLLTRLPFHDVFLCHVTTVVKLLTPNSTV